MPPSLLTRDCAGAIAAPERPGLTPEAPLYRQIGSSRFGTDSIYSFGQGPLKARVLAVVIAFLLSGCAIVWGKPYKIEHESSSSTTITYDPGLTNKGEVQNIAQGICAQYGKDAIPQSSTTSSWGHTSTSFICQPKVPGQLNVKP